MLYMWSIIFFQFTFHSLSIDINSIRSFFKKNKFALSCVCFFSKKASLLLSNQAEYNSVFCLFLSSDCHFFKTEGTVTIPNDFCHASWSLRSLSVHHSQEFNAYRCSMRRTHSLHRKYVSNQETSLQFPFDEK